MAETATTDEVEIEPPDDAPAEKQQDEFVAKLSKIYQRLKYSKKLKVAMKEVEKDLLDLLGENFEIRVPFSTTSLSGYVALSQRSLVVKNVMDSQELTDIHPRLQFDSSFSEARGWKG